MLRRFQQQGHRPIAIAGGATGMIGDPSGKSAERNLLTAEQLQRNLNGLQQQLVQLLDFECGEHSAVMVNNFDWISRFSYIEFLRDVGKYFPVNVMLAKDSVKSRLAGDAGLSYTEFSYMLLQAYDFVYLYRKYNCELQVGGSDQWGNVTAGIDLARRMLGVQLYGLTCPLLTKSDGGKMGKTESGTIWLSAERTSPYVFYQYWINTDDQDVGKCLRFLTELGREEIESLDEALALRPHVRESQKRLAEELTRLIHGAAALAKAQKASEFFFGAEIESSSDSELEQIFMDVPRTAAATTSRQNSRGNRWPVKR
jgi:tyrosyl-tRNA synthetase